MMFWLARFELYAHSCSQSTQNERKDNSQGKIQEPFQKKGGVAAEQASRHQLQRFHFCTFMVSHCKILSGLLNCLPFPTRLWIIGKQGLCFLYVQPLHLAQMPDPQQTLNKGWFNKLMSTNSPFRNGTVILYIQEERDHFPFSIISSVYRQREERRSGFQCNLFHVLGFYYNRRKEIIVHLHITSWQLF